MMNPRTLLATSAVWLALAGCATSPAPQSIADTTASTPSLSTLNRLIADAGLTETLRGAGPYTVFAPSDDAFKALPPKTLASLTQDKEQLKAVLLYHVAPGKVLAADVKPGSVDTAQGSKLALSRAGSFVTVEEALVTQADVPATNGVVHVIDKVLIPPVKK